MAEAQNPVEPMSPLKLAFAARSMGDARRILAAEPIAVVGMGCRFPGRADSPSAFRILLENGVDAVGEIPPGRWDVDGYYDSDPEAPGRIRTRRGGFLPSVDGFDARFFGISPREARGMDPQQRLLLEVAWEALEHGNQNPLELFRRPVGVFVGISTFDYAMARLAEGRPGDIDPYYVSGNVLSVAAGRLSYILGLTGPSMSVDTACSSSLVSVHLACRSLRERECDMALAGGVGLILAPEPYVNFTKAGMLSADGRCKSFDAAADGYGRGEGCGVIVLKRLSDAIAEGDFIHALIRGSAVNQDGASGGLTFPSGPSQAAVIRSALLASGIRPEQVGCLEAHGTGTSLGDPIEMGAIAAVFGGRRRASLMVGSVKSNFGHLEAAAGVAGLIKAILSLENLRIYPSLHFSTPNPNIDWGSLNVAVPTTARVWESPEGRWISGVSSFGFAGTNAHVVLERFAAPSAPPPVSSSGPGLHLLTLSARDPEALKALAGRYAVHLEDNPALDIAAVCHTARSCRADFSHRLAVTGRDLAVLSRSLSRFAEGQQDPCVKTAVVTEVPGREGARRPAAGAPDAAVMEAAEDYLGGKPAAGLFLSPEKGPGRVKLPTYPFQHTPFWFDGTDRARSPGWKKKSGTGGDRETAGMKIPYPGRRLELPFSEEVRFAARYSERFPDFIPDHRLFGALVVAGASHMAMLLEGAERIYGETPCTIRNMVLTDPLIVPEGGARSVQWVFSPEEKSDRYRFRVCSTREEDREGDFWREHVQGLLARGAEAGAGFDAAATLRGGAFRPLMDGEDLYRRIASQGHHLGETFHWVLRVWQQGNEGICRMGFPVAASGDYRLHPGLIDSAFQFFCIHGPAVAFGEVAEALTGDAIYIPFSVEEIRFHRRPQRQEALWCRTLVAGGDPGRRSITGEIGIFGGQGVEIATFRGITATRADRAALFKPARDGLAGQAHDGLLYEIRWQAPEDGAGQGGTDDMSSGAVSTSWLILSGGGKGADPVAAVLSNRLLKMGAKGADVTVLAPGGPGDTAVQGWLGRAAGNDRPITIVYLNALRETASEDGAPASREPENAIMEDQKRICGPLLSLVGALFSFGLTDRTRLWIVTRDPRDKGRESLGQSTLWGLGRVVRLEHPGMDTRLVGLSDDGGDAVEALIRELLSPGREKEMAFTGNGPAVPRLRSFIPRPRRSPLIRAEATYLITGGLGALGLSVARRFVRMGAKNLVLVGRRPPSEAAREEIAQLQVMGTRIHLFQADVAEAQAVERLFRGMEGVGLPPLRGIVHAAGVVDDRLLIRQDFDRLRRVLAPKVAGGWHLHRQSRHMELDHFVLFSSAGSLLGAAGQANYAAANAFLDALAHHRRAQGKPALSINWAGWEGGGMLARLGPRERDRLSELGWGTIPRERGLDILELLMAQDVPQVAVLPLDWKRYGESFPEGGSPCLVEGLLKEAPTVSSPSPEPAGAIRGLLARALPGERRGILAAFVATQVKEILGFDAAAVLDPDEGLFDAGMDSLMAVRLKERLEAGLGCRLSPTLMFNHPSVEAITEHLASRVIPEDFSGKGQGSGGPAEESEEALLDDLSEEELARLVDETLEEMETSGVKRMDR